MRHSKYIGTLQLDKSIAKELNNDILEEIFKCCTDALERYWGR